MSGQFLRRTLNQFKNTRIWSRYTSTSTKKEFSAKNHVQIGEEQDLYFFNELAPGSCFFTPNGTKIYNILIDFIKDENKKQGIKDVLTPNISKTKLWKNSNEWDHHGKCLYEIPVKKETYGLKHVNNHLNCLIFNHEWNIRHMNLSTSTYRSWRDLPIRFSDFGVLHNCKNVSHDSFGLFALNRFQRDDKHIFCTDENISFEISRLIQSIQYIYNSLGIDFILTLNKHFSSDYLELENNIIECLTSTQAQYNIELEEHDPCFAPKINIKIKDKSGNFVRTGFIQFDFELVKKFNLKYFAVEAKIPIYINCSAFGSFEQIIGILAEYYEGVWPFWLSPKQVLIIPKTNNLSNTNNINNYLTEMNIRSDIGPCINEIKLTNDAKYNHYSYYLEVGENINDYIKLYNKDFEYIISLTNMTEVSTHFKGLLENKV